MNDLPKPDMIRDEHGIHILRANGTYSTHRDMLRLPDGQILTTLATGDTMTTDEATARDITGWTGLIFTAEQKQAQQDYQDAKPPARFVDGAMLSDPHPAYAEHLTALERGDVEAAVLALIDLDEARGYSSSAATWAAAEWVIVRFTRDYDVKSGRAFVAGDLALARATEGGEHLTAFSVRSGHHAALEEGYYELVPPASLAGALPDLSQVRCVYCGHVGIRVEWRLEAKPLGTWSLAGVQEKYVASHWPYAICNGCGHVSRGQQA